MCTSSQKLGSTLLRRFSLPATSKIKPAHPTKRSYWFSTTSTPSAHPISSTPADCTDLCAVTDAVRFVLRLHILGQSYIYDF